VRLAIPFSILMAFASCAWVMPAQPQSSIEIEVGPPHLLVTWTNCDTFSTNSFENRRRMQRCVGRI